MENNKTLLNQHIENVKGSFGSYFTQDKLKNDFFKGKESEIFSVFNYKDELYEMELSIHDEFTVMSVKMKFDFRGFTHVCIDVAIGGLDDTSGYPAAGKCYINMEYDSALELHDCILRDFY
ncbi:hypothetical protein A3860_29975 [Niastella vici]|uniref:Uncharacterized protein n=1 Tax=Niastella vici TaxID=1703345 RepID=A0A1V9FUL6_9BACT|nr:hypothetical protein [Niastella vici]OQP61926.1 hypothetical protein A3860_29975 [Niastella vici]